MNGTASEEVKLPETVQTWIRAKLEYHQGNLIMSDSEFNALEAKVVRDHPYHWLQHVGLCKTHDKSRVQPTRDVVDRPIHRQPIDRSEHDFPYQSVCLTGKPAQLGTWLRKDIIADLEAMDVTVHSSVRADTEALVQGDPSSQTRKTAAAQARGIPIIFYEDMRDLMDAPSVSPTHTITR